MSIIESLGLSHPIIQAPMAGVSTPAMAAAVSNAGALGSIAVGATDAAGARAMIEAVRAQTSGPFNVNLFTHRPARSDPVREGAWLATLTPLFQAYDAQPPTGLREIYRSFVEDDAMLSTLVELAPPVVSFHFGLPNPTSIAALKRAGCLLLATVTSPVEARAAREAGIDAIVAQGYEAGGHRGAFDPEAPDDQLGTFALTRLLAAQCDLPVVAAGGIMDGQGIRAALALGAVAAQLGTAFIACTESSADAAYRAALTSPAAHHTAMTRAISGRPARCLANRFTAWGAEAALQPPAYPIAYDVGKALNTAAKAKGEGGFGAQWAGQGAPLARALPAAELIGLLAREMQESA
ncbi:NAD(P)H-dependent flavin oxidoreductase [Sphingobium fuliginis]|uniref:Nitronate monooxygenase n=1 Tax=Sphingobium fuliginis ATCC 27551 TaxID=1208342 RepID=A0A5B8CGB1_SPHSA|nr:nitronate monooxygenase [Sphingobium fuliginis]QDC37316.1 nitronate monooxygenase [Sphingobium fuliginis ATCC 27551]